jgi:hypothetical protein
MDQNSKAKKRGPLIHGIYSKDFLLAWEDRDEFAALHDGLRQEYFPDGTSEEEAVFDLAQLHWTKRTLWRMRAAIITADNSTQVILATKGKSWVEIRQALRQKAKEERAVIDAMENKLLKMFSRVSRLAKKLIDEPRSEASDQLAEELKEALDLFQEVAVPEMKKIGQLPDIEDALDRNFIPEDLEKIVDIGAMLEARITKVTARLVAIKEFKRTPAGSRPKQLVAPRPVVTEK